MVALDMSLGSATRMVSPLLGTALLASQGYAFVCTSSAALMAALCVVLLAAPSAVASPAPAAPSPQEAVSAKAN